MMIMEVAGRYVSTILVANAIMGMYRYIERPKGSFNLVDLAMLVGTSHQIHHRTCLNPQPCVVILQ